MAAFALCGDGASAKVFTGAFSGQGEACWGNLYIRTKTIEWDTDYSVCRGPYTIVAHHYTGDAPHEQDDFILYKLDRASAKCRYSYIALYYFDYSDYSDTDFIKDDWAVAGFPTLKDYETFPYRRYLDGDTSDPGPGVPRVLFCSLPTYK